MGYSLDREEVQSGKKNRLAGKSSGNKRLAVSMKLKSEGVKITAKGNYTQEVMWSKVNCGDGVVLGKHMILAVGSLSAWQMQSQCKEHWNLRKP